MHRSISVDGILFVALVDPPAESLRCPGCFAPLKQTVKDDLHCVVGPTESCCAAPLRMFPTAEQAAEWARAGWEQLRRAA